MKIIDLLSSSDKESQLLGIQLLESHPDYENFKDKHMYYNGTIYIIKELIDCFNQDYCSDHIFSETLREAKLELWSYLIIKILHKYRIDI